jgi:hypothetical protein
MACLVWDGIVLVPLPFGAGAFTRTARKAGAAPNGAAFESPQLFSASTSPSMMKSRMPEHYRRYATAEKSGNTDNRKT